MTEVELEQELTALNRGEFEEGGLHGYVLDLVGRVRELPGEDYSDQECLYIIRDVLTAWSKLDDQGLI